MPQDYSKRKAYEDRHRVERADKRKAKKALKSAERE